MGGTAVDPISGVVQGSSIDEPTPAPTRTDATFNGWYLDRDCTIQWDFLNDVVTANLNLYAKWVAAVSIAPEAPGTPGITEAYYHLVLSWTAVSDATTYEVWYSTANDSGTATQHGGDITGTSYTIDGLDAGTTYYVWLKAKNSYGTSEFSVEGSGTPAALSPPDTPMITTGDLCLSVEWTTVTDATAYEVWYNTTNDSGTATQHGGDITGTSYTIDNLTNGTTYYVWLKAKNSYGTSEFGYVSYGSPSPYYVYYDGNGSTYGTPPTDANSPYSSPNYMVPVLGNSGSPPLQRTYDGGLNQDVFLGWNKEPDGSGTGYVVNDAFTISQNTTLYADWLWQYNDYISFNSTGTPYTDYVSLGNSDDLKPGSDRSGDTTELAIEMWVYADDWQVVARQKLIGSNEGGGCAIYLENGTMVFELFIEGAYQTVDAQVTAFTGWHHVAVTYDRQNAKIYLDGALMKTYTHASVIGITYHSSNSIILGAEAGPADVPTMSGGDNDDYFTGCLDDIRIWNIARSETEISGSLNTELDGTETGLVGYYKADSSGGAIFTDMTGSYNGVVNGAVYGSGRF